MKRRAERDPQREKWIQIIGFSIIGVITLGLLIVRLQNPTTYVKVAEAQEVEKEQVALIRVVYDKAGIERLIRETFPEEPNTAVAVVKGEGGLVNEIQSHFYQNGIREPSFCAFQIHEPSWMKEAQRLGYGDYKTNVESCVKMARHIYDLHGWYPWSAYKNGGYKRHL